MFLQGFAKISDELICFNKKFGFFPVDAGSGVACSKFHGFGVHPDLQDQLGKLEVDLKWI